MHNCVVKLDWGEGKGSWSYVVLFCIYLCIQCLTPLMLKVQNHTLLRWLVNAALCDKGCQWHLARQWPYVGTLQKQKDSSYKSIIVKSGANHLIIPWNKSNFLRDHQMTIHVQFESNNVYSFYETAFIHFPHRALS